MPRRGWQQLDVPSGWVRVLRGPRPKSEQWPARERKEGGHASTRTGGVARSPVPSAQPDFVEDASSSATEPCARGRRSRSHRGGSQVASRSVGPRRGKRPFEAFVESSGRCSIEIPKFAPVDKRIESCKGFLERARKRAGRSGGSHCEGYDREGRVSAGNCRKRTPFGAVGSTSCKCIPTPVDAPDRCLSGKSCRRGSTFCRRSGMHLLAAPTPVLPRPVWMGDGPPSLDNIPPLPSANVQDVEHWLNCRNCEMRNALEYGDPGIVARCGSLVAQGAAMLANLSQDVPMVARSTLMSALINEGDTKRRCVEGGLLGVQ